MRWQCKMDRTLEFSNNEPNIYVNKEFKVQRESQNFSLARGNHRKILLEIYNIDGLIN